MAFIFLFAYADTGPWLSEKFAITLNVASAGVNIVRSFLEKPNISLATKLVEDEKH